MSKEIVLGTVEYFDWVQLGAGIKHPEYGKVIDISDSVRSKTGVNDANVKIIPYNGYGDIVILRKLISEEKPDALLHFTDPHYWQWLYDNEHEIRQHVPILYWHVWDNLPDPKYNRNYYESCDWIGCISKQTYGIVKRVGKLTDSITYKPLKDEQIDYVPHGINPEIFKPLDNVSERVRDLIDKERKYEFILFYNNRNIRRKQPSDVIHSYKLFCDTLPKNESKKCLLLMHTVSIDNNGTDLTEVVNNVCPNYDVMITDNKLDQNVLNELYNLSDCTINISNNEGFGLSTAESLMAGTPIIVNVTGGLQDQCGFKLNEENYVDIGSLHDMNMGSQFVEWGTWAFLIWPSSISLTGSVPTPYIFEDRAEVYNVAKMITVVYNLGKDERKKRGQLGREFMLENLSSKLMCEKLTNGINKTINNFSPRERFELYKII